MTFEELEVEVKSLKQQMLTIANRTSERDGKTESGLSNVSVKTDTIAALDGASYNPRKQYVEDELCVYGSSIARCKFTCVGVEPSNSTYWELKSIAEVLVELANKLKEKEN